MANLPALYAEAWTTPRQSMRRILSLDLSERDRLIMVAITGVLFAIPVALAFRTLEMPVGPDGIQLARPSVFLIATMVVLFNVFGYYLSAALIKGIGSVFGGTATYVESKTVSAWAQLVTGLANLVLLVISLAMPTVLMYPLRLVFTIAALIVSSAFIAEAHGFRSVANVVAVVFAASIGLVLILSSMMPLGALPGAS